MKVLITRPRAQSESFGEALQAAGFEPIYFPVIEIHPVEDHAELDTAIKNIHQYDWVVFTSVNAVDVFFNIVTRKSLSPTTLAPNASAGEQSPVPQVAAIGPKTADALRKHNLEPDFIPDEYVAESILPGLGDLRGKWVLLPRPEVARKALPEAIVKAGGVAHEIIIYKTLPTQPNAEGIAALKSGVDVVTLTSPSTVKNFCAIARQNKLDPLHLPNNPLFACIGPITEQAAREEGITNFVTAKEYTTEGLIETIRLKV
jgi:uroporphyrinogen III methyltransferase/synthase